MMDLNGALKHIIASSALTLNLTSNVNNRSESKFEETILTFNKITPGYNDEREPSKTARIKTKINRLKKVS